MHRVHTDHIAVKMSDFPTNDTAKEQGFSSRALLSSFIAMLKEAEDL